MTNNPPLPDALEAFKKFVNAFKLNANIGPDFHWSTSSFGLWEQSIISALQSPTPEWQPIETAPRDGTIILMFYPTRYLGPNKTIVGKWTKYNGGSWQNDEFSMSDTPEQPTHWMPLPAAPKPDAEGG